MGKRPAPSHGPRRTRFAPSQLRIVGGTHRGRKITYSGDPLVRPMKDRTREAVFNLLGPLNQTFHAMDLFAGTGALALEALSRGVAAATLVERHRPTARTIRKNIDALQLSDRADVVETDVFRYVRRTPFPESPRHLVFCCPPYRLYHEQREAMLELIQTVLSRFSSESILVVEADLEFPFELLPDAERWRQREYAPARVGVWHAP